MEIHSTVCVPVLSKPLGVPCLELAFADGDDWKTVKLDRQEVLDLGHALVRVHRQVEAELASANASAS